MKTFENFTNLYELSKTLRFELKPFIQTKKQLEIDGVIEKDISVQENYQKIKEKLDELHIVFVGEALKNVDISLLGEYEKKYINLKSDSKNKKYKAEYEKVLKAIRKEIGTFFTVQGNIWKEKYSFLKKGGIGCLTEKEVLDLLPEFFPEDKDTFEAFKGFFTYFQNFNESRKNFYADDGRSGAISTRIIDENLATFLENKKKFEIFSSSHPDFFTEQEKEIFTLDYYNSCLLQNGISKYNQIIGAKNLGEGVNTVGINQRINLLKQRKEHSNKKDIKYPKFDLLYKQILSKQDKQDFIQTIEDNTELFQIIETSILRNDEKIKEVEKILINFCDTNNNYDLEYIYFSKGAINTISNKYFESWNTLAGYLGESSKQSFISFSEIKNIFEKQKEDNIFKEQYYKNNITFATTDNYENFLAVFRYELLTNISKYQNTKQALERLNLLEYKKTSEQVAIIKNYFDSVMDIYSMSRYFNVEKNKKKVEEYNKDSIFYTDFDNYFGDFEIWKIYNLIRNYISKKDIQTDKIKLNFENSQFLTGWDKDKEKERFGSIFKKDSLYYLVLLKKGNNKVFEKYTYNGETDFYEKMEYKQLNNVYRQLPRLTFPLQKKLDSLTGDELEKYIDKYRETFGYNEEIAEIKKEFDIFQKEKEVGEKFNLKKLKKLIKYYQNAVIVKYGKIYDLKSIETREYEDLAIFYDEIETKMYSLTFTNISAKYLDELEKSGQIYMFQIYNKDFSENKKENSQENIHTKYFKYLFDPRNLENLKIKLSGGAEIFFREKTKNIKQRKDRLGKDLFYGENKDKKVLKNRRYSQDKIFFHISTTLNANRGDMYKFNNFFNKNFKPKHIIGIDRGEKHLAYYSVIDREGNIVETESLNVVNSTNYLEKLEEKEASRKQGRLNWGEIENIKNLKNGYISALVHKLSELIIKYEAIIVFEDLNSGFKRGRQKIEKQVYQKLELALAKKLNYLTFKDKNDTEIGGTLNAIQLVPRVNDYADIGNYKQSGIVFYTNPAYTSTTCPVCGWRKTLKFPTKINIKNLQKFFSGITISYDEEKFSFTYKNIHKNNETLYSNVERVSWNNKKRQTEHHDINDEFLKLFEENNVDIHGNISKQVQSNEVSSSFLKSLFYIFKMINNIRNSDSEKGEDIISCPCCGYHSNNGFQQIKDFNGDANGAFNIARKGMIMLENIEVNPEKPNLYISNDDWDEFLGRKKITLLDIIND